MTPAQWGKWAFIGLSAVAIVMTAASDDRGGTAKTARVKTQHPVHPSGALSRRPELPVTLVRRSSSRPCSQLGAYWPMTGATAGLLSQFSLQCH